MPVQYFDLVEGRKPDEVRRLLDSAHAAVLATFEVPECDHYQLVNTHSADEIITLDTGLGIGRSERLVVIHPISRRRTSAKSNACLRCSPRACAATAVWTRQF